MKSAGTSTLRTVAVLLLAAAFSLVTGLGTKGRDAGSDLKGWRPIGPIDWRSEGSQFVGSSRQAKSGNGWLIQDQRHEDVRLSLSFECYESDAGVLLRGTEIEHRLQGVYVPICGAGVGTVLRLGINPDGTKVEPSTIATFHSSTDRPSISPQYRWTERMRRMPAWEARMAISTCSRRTAGSTAVGP